MMTQVDREMTKFGKTPPVALINTDNDDITVNTNNQLVGYASYNNNNQNINLRNQFILTIYFLFKIMIFSFSIN